VAAILSGSITDQKNGMAAVEYSPSQVYPTIHGAIEVERILWK
jgi:hypothetical protein